MDTLRAAFFILSKRAAPGIDGLTWDAYADGLEENLLDLHRRVHTGAYRALPSRRRYIPKADGKQRPLGIAAMEDKIVQAAVKAILTPIYEAEFPGFSYGFRPGRGQHDALDALAYGIKGRNVRWVLDADISRFFDSLSHTHLRGFLDQRVKDGVVRKMIDKWLKAGVLEEGVLSRATGGTPQGGVISPLLSNIFLHHVLDEWFETVARPRLQGQCLLTRYADDAVMAFEDRADGETMLAVLGKRLGRYGLTLHPTKTRFVDFRAARVPSDGRGGGDPAAVATTFDFLGLTHVWGKSRKGRNVIWQITAKGRYARALASVTQWCRRNRHRPFPDQHAHLSRMIRGHCAYYGVTGNNRRIRWYRYQLVRIWKKWLSRRGRQNTLNWSRFEAMLKQHPLPPARIVHQYAAP